MAVEIPRYLADPEQGVTLRNGASVRVRAIRPDERASPAGAVPSVESAHGVRAILLAEAAPSRGGARLRQRRLSPADGGRRRSRRRAGARADRRGAVRSFG